MSRKIPLLFIAALGTLLLVAACGSDDPAAPAATTLKVLVLSDGGTEDHVLAVLGAAGMDTTRGANWWEDVGEDLYRYDVVVMLNGYDYSHSMSDIAQVRLTQFVADGGGLIVTEWFNYYPSRNPLLSAIMPVTGTADYDYETDTLRPVAGHPLASSLPGSFSTGPDWTWATLAPDTTAVKQARIAVNGDLGGPAVVTGVFGRGRTVAWGMAGTYNGSDIWTPGVEQLLKRIVWWAGQ